MIRLINPNLIDRFHLSSENTFHLQVATLGEQADMEILWIIFDQLKKLRSHESPVFLRFYRKIFLSL